MSPEQETGTLADLMRDDPNNSGVMAAMPIGSIQQDQLSRLGVRLDSAGHYLEQFERHAEYLLEMLMAATSRRDYLQEQVSKDAFWLDQFRECLRIFPPDWEAILRILMERQERVKKATDEVVAFMAETWPDSNEAHCVRIRLGQILKLATGEREEADRQFCYSGNEAEISSFVRTGSIYPRPDGEIPEAPKGEKKHWHFTCQQCGEMPIVKVNGELNWEQKLEVGAELQAPLTHLSEKNGYMEEHVVEWFPF